MLTITTYTMRRQIFSCEYFRTVINVSDTVITCVRRTRMYNVKCLGGPFLRLNHVGINVAQGSCFSHGTEYGGIQLQISHFDDRLGTDVYITRGSSII